VFCARSPIQAYAPKTTTTNTLSECAWRLRSTPGAVLKLEHKLVDTHYMLCNSRRTLPQRSAVLKLEIKLRKVGCERVVISGRVCDVDLFTAYLLLAKNKSQTLAPRNTSLCVGGREDLHGFSLSKALCPF